MKIFSLLFSLIMFQMFLAYIVNSIFGIVELDPEMTKIHIYLFGMTIPSFLAFYLLYKLEVVEEELKQLKNKS